VCVAAEIRQLFAAEVCQTEDLSWGKSWTRNDGELLGWRVELAAGACGLSCNGSDWMACSGPDLGTYRLVISFFVVTRL